MKNIGIVGAGQMGSGIAQVCAAAGLEVILSDVSEGAWEQARSAICRNLERQVQAGKIAAPDAAATMQRISFSATLRTFSGCDCAIEAATESENVKEEILTSLEAIIRPDAVLATNTSSV